MMNDENTNSTVTASSGVLTADDLTRFIANLKDEMNAGDMQRLYEETVQPAPHPAPLVEGEKMTVEQTAQLYEALQSQGVPLVDTSGQRLTDLIPDVTLPAHSVQGDMVWQACQYVLRWLVEYGDEELQVKAYRTHEQWNTEQEWLISWCKERYYFHWCQLATHNVKAYKQAMRMFPSESSSVASTLRTLALAFAEDFTQPKPRGLRHAVPVRYHKRTSRHKPR